MELHIIPHSHWDREWYMDFERHRIRLVRLLDDVMDTMESDPEFTHFHLDGHILPIFDYLEIRPENKERLYRLIREGKIQVGPFYILQDCFLTSGEANIRNLTMGISLCEKEGFPICKLGYFPDTFGNISQTPQILADAGFEYAAFGRGITNTGNNNFVNAGDYNKSELIWESPDGSRVKAIMFANWYSNANELPSGNASETVRRFDEIVSNAKKYATTPYLLGMNGCDHQPLQKNLTACISEARKLYGNDHGVDIKISSFDEYCEKVGKDCSGYGYVKGEIAGQYTTGKQLLVGTASARIKTKQLNQYAQNIIERHAEPLAVLDALTGGKYDGDYFSYLWKLLMQNHAHDSICGCNVDEVDREVGTRLNKVISLSTALCENAKADIASKIDTAAFEHGAVVVFNMQPHRVKGNVKVIVSVSDSSIRSVGLRYGGKKIAAECKPLGKRFTYTLPNDSFRKVAYLYQFELTFTAELDGLGYKSYEITYNDVQSVENSDIALIENGCETPYIKLTVNGNGSVNVLDKQSGKNYIGLNVYEDCGDCGDEYDFAETSCKTRVCSVDSVAEISRSRSADAVTFRISQTLRIPSHGDGKTRSREYADVPIVTRVTVNAYDAAVRFCTTVNNTAKDHRLRALFPTDTVSDKAFAKTPLDVTEREIMPWSGWQNESNLQRHSGFVGICNERSGALIATRGLYEYEVPPRAPSTVAVTLLRAVGQMGDWGVFPTPDAQCLGEHTLEYAFIPYRKQDEHAAFAAAEDFTVRPLECITTDRHAGTLAAERIFYRLQGEKLFLSALKKEDNGDGVIMRFVNYGVRETQATVYSDAARIYRTNITEEVERPLKSQAGRVELQVPAKKIITLKLKG